MRKLLLVGSALALLAAPAVLAEGEEVDLTHETQADVDGDGSLETLKNGYTDAHPWVDAPVLLEGSQIAEIERVHFDGEDIDKVVIETEGFAEVGGREVEIALDEIELTAEEDGSASFDLTLSQAELDALPDFDEDLASDYPLSNAPAE